MLKRSFDFLLKGHLFIGAWPSPRLPTFWVWVLMLEVLGNFIFVHMNTLAVQYQSCPLSSRKLDGS